MVEDEPLVRAFVCEALQHHGYRVLEADCGQKALEVWERAGQGIDLLLTDMVMPNGISGSSLAKMLLDHKQELKVIYMSGYTPEITGLRRFVQRSPQFPAETLQSGQTH